MIKCADAARHAALFLVGLFAQVLLTRCLCSGKAAAAATATCSPCGGGGGAPARDSSRAEGLRFADPEGDEGKYYGPLDPQGRPHGYGAMDAMLGLVGTGFDATSDEGQPGQVRASRPIEVEQLGLGADPSVIAASASGRSAASNTSARSARRTSARCAGEIEKPPDPAISDPLGYPRTVKNRSIFFCCWPCPLPHPPTP